MHIFIEGGRALLGGEIGEASLEIADGKISAVDGVAAHTALNIDAGGLLAMLRPSSLRSRQGWRFVAPREDARP